MSSHNIDQYLVSFPLPAATKYTFLYVWVLWCRFLSIYTRYTGENGTENRLNHSHDFHSRKRFIGENGVYGSRAERREVSFRTCGRQDGGTAVYGGGRFYKRK